MTYNASIMSVAEEHLGLKEFPGAKHNPQILEMFDKAGQGWVQDDETAWCAAFVASVLSSVGLPHTGRLDARSYLDWGVKVEMQQARAGDVVVLWRGTKDGWQGHVGFLVSFSGSDVVLRGGNQGNQVSDAAFPVNRILGIRRHDGVSQVDGKRPILRKGDNGVFVLEMQTQLAAHRYFLGDKDGKFGSRTLGAVVAFQADHALKADGVVGEKTWDVLLGDPASRILRDKTEGDLRAKEEPTIQAADRGQLASAVTGALVGVPVIITQVEAAMDAAVTVRGTMDRMMGMGVPVLIVTALLLGGLVIWYQFGRVKAARVEDAQTGANDKV